MHREIDCPLCHSELVDLVQAEFVFRCGTLYGTQGGLGALYPSARCLASRRASANMTWSDHALNSAIRKRRESLAECENGAGISSLGRQAVEDGLSVRCR